MLMNLLGNSLRSDFVRILGHAMLATVQKQIAKRVELINSRTPHVVIGLGHVIRELPRPLAEVLGAVLLGRLASRATITALMASIRRAATGRAITAGPTTTSPVAGVGRAVRSMTGTSAVIKTTAGTVRSNFIVNDDP